MKKKILKLIVVLVAVLAILVAIAPTLAGGFVKDRVAATLARSLDADVSIDSLSLGWLSGVELEGLDARRGGEEPLHVEVRSLVAAPELGALLSGDVVVPDLRVDGVVLHVTRPADRPAKKSEPIELPSVDVKATFTDLTIVYEDPAFEGRCEVRALERVTAHLRSGRPLDLRLSDAGLDVTAAVALLDGSRVRKPGAVTAEGRVRASAFALERLAAALAPWATGLTGRLEMDEAFTWEGGSLKLTGSAAVEEVALELPGRPGRQQAAKLTLATELTLDRDLRGSGTLVAGGEALALAGLPGVRGVLDVTSLSLRSRLKPGGMIELEEVAVSSPAAAVRASGSLEWTPGDSGLRGRVKGSVDGDVARLAAIVGGLPRLGGRLDGRFDYIIGDGGAMQVRGRTLIADFTADDLPGGVAPVREKQIVLHHDFDYDGRRLEMKKVALQSSFARADVTGHLTGLTGDGVPAGDLAVDADVDLTTAAALAGDRIPVELAGRAGLKGRVTGEGGGKGLLLDATLRGQQVRATSGPLGETGYDLDTVTAELRGTLSADRDELSLETVKVSSRLIGFDGALGLTGLRGETPAVRITGDSSFDADRLLAPFYSIEADKPLGRARAHLDVEKRGRDISVRAGRIAATALDADVQGSLSLRDDGLPEGKLTITSARLRLENLSPLVSAFMPYRVRGFADARGTVELGDVVALDLELAGKGLNLAPLAFAGPFTRGADVDSGKLVARYWSKKGATGIETLTLKGADLDVDLSRTRKTSEGLTLYIDGNASLARLAPAIRPWLDVDVEGRADVKGTIVKAGRITTNLQGRATGLKLSGPLLAGRTLHAGELSFGSKGAFGGDLPVALEKLNVGARQARLTQVSGAELSGDFDLWAMVAEDGKFEMSGRGEGLATREKPGAAPVRMTSPLRLSAGGSYRPDSGAYDIDELRLIADGIDARGKGRYESGKTAAIDLAAQLRMDELARSWLTLFLPEARGQGAGRLVLSGTFPLDAEKPMAAGSGTADIGLGRLSFTGIDIRGLEAKAKLEGGVGRITEGTARVNGGPATITGEIDFREAEPRFKGAIDAKRVEIVKELQPAVARIIPIFAGLQATVTTFVDLELSLDGKGSELEKIKPTLSGGGNVQCADGQVVGSPLLRAMLGAVGVDPDLRFRSISSRFQVQGGRVHQDAMVIDGSTVDFRLAGTTGLDGSLDYEIGVRPERPSPEFKRFASLVDRDGFLPLGLGGTISSPVPKMPDPGKLLGGAIEGVLREKLGKGLGGLLGGGRKKKDGDEEKKREDPDR